MIRSLNDFFFFLIRVIWVNRSIHLHGKNKLSILIICFRRSVFGAQRTDGKDQQRTGAQRGRNEVQRIRFRPVEVRTRKRNDACISVVEKKKK